MNVEPSAYIWIISHLAIIFLIQIFLCRYLVIQATHELINGHLNEPLLVNSQILEDILMAAMFKQLSLRNQKYYLSSHFCRGC